MFALCLCCSFVCGFVAVCFADAIGASFGMVNLFSLKG